ncbi:hypothetical protein Pmani_007045 [Petrolisthes manimaculis]|uniref:Uncharacterized protein n=1 Tax=Petrolisthes manimaculis TaxID=1843537 RepID=A0AAE1UL66_9EUCA|nr:hypothetical protein Pmani_007045 [Petrolisthes manimaculis]
MASRDSESNPDSPQAIDVPSVSIENESEVEQGRGRRKPRKMKEWGSVSSKVKRNLEHWKQSQTKVVVVGARANVKDIFLHHSFRNTVDGIYLAVNPNIFITQNSRPYIRVQLPHKDQLVNFEGRKLKFIAASLFPYMDFPMDIDETPVPIIPYDTVDVRLAETLAMKHNFT